MYFGCSFSRLSRLPTTSTQKYIQRFLVLFCLLLGGEESLGRATSRTSTTLLFPRQTWTMDSLVEFIAEPAEYWGPHPHQGLCWAAAMQIIIVTGDTLDQE